MLPPVAMPSALDTNNVAHQINCSLIALLSKLLPSLPGLHDVGTSSVSADELSVVCVGGKASRLNAVPLLM